MSPTDPAATWHAQRMQAPRVAARPFCAPRLRRGALPRYARRAARRRCFLPRVRIHKAPRLPWCSSSSTFSFLQGVRPSQCRQLQTRSQETRLSWCLSSRRSHKSATSLFPGRRGSTAWLLMPWIDSNGRAHCLATRRTQFRVGQTVADRQQSRMHQQPRATASCSLCPPCVHALISRSISMDVTYSLHTHPIHHATRLPCSPAMLARALCPSAHADTLRSIRSGTTS